jgi:hypothetical protein
MNIILAFCLAGHPVHAQNFFLGVCELARENRNPIPGDAVIRELVLAWRKSDDPQAALNAKALVKRMQELRVAGYVK